LSVLLQFVAALAVALCAFCIGYSLGYTSPALPSMSDRQVTSFEVTPQMGSWVGGIMPLCGMFGALLGGPMLTLIGRRLTILLSSVPFIGSFILIFFAYSIDMVLGGRAVGGIGLGIATVSVPVYLGEVLHQQVRGTLGLMPTLVGNLGIMMCYVVGAYTTWRNLALVGAFCCLPYAGLMIALPETPRWYLARGKTEKATKSLTWLRKKDADINGELQQMSQDDDNEFNACKEVFQKKNIRPVGISLGLMFFQQTTGYNAVLFYTVMIFQASGTHFDSFASTILVGAVNFIATLMAVIVIDRLGRKVLLLMSLSSMISTLFILSVFFYCLSKKINTSQFEWLPLLTFVIYVMGFSMGIGPISWLMMGEILPSRIRGIAASFIVAFNWGCAFLVTKTFQDLIDLMGIHGVFGLFCCMCIVALLFIIYLVPETKNKSLEEIEAEL
ncbi:hypothetical protein KR222_000152, partial [Zaprionus bogoriensis]